MAGDIEIRAKWKTQEVRALMAKLQGKKLNQALSVAVNDTARQVEREAEKNTAKTLSIPSKRAKLGIWIRPYSTAATLTAVVRGSGSTIPLKAFGAKEEGSGVTAKIWGAKVHHPGAFIMGGRDGARVPLKMGGHVFHRPGSGRLPIAKSKGASISEAMSQEAVSSANETVGVERLQVNIMRQLTRYARVKARRT